MKRRKNLEKAIVLGLLLSTSVYGTAWAGYNVSEDGKTLTITDSQLGSNNSKYDGKNISDFEKVNVTFKGNHGNDPYSYRLDAPKTDVTITIKSGFSMNDDGIHLTNWDPHFVVRDYTANISSLSSDALNLSHDATNPYAIIYGDLNATVSSGSGIRANASWRSVEQVAKITVHGTTDISVTGSFPFSDVAIVGVYAGADTEYNANKPEGEDFNNKTKGQGIIELFGKTTINTNASKSYGIWAGKNGNINVHDLEINAKGNNAIGLAATTGNITYGTDDSESTFDSIVTMNGENNVITMVNGGKALFADANNKIYGDKDVIIQSGSNGIGSLNVKGDVVATNCGKIDLDIRDWVDITGNIEAINDATINLSIKEDTTGISLMSNTPKAMNITGDIQAANGSTINLSIGNNAKLTGRIDDYKDADNKEIWANLGHDSLFDEDFAKDVEKSGNVNLTLGNNSEWFVTEQSWATSVKTTEGAHSTIDLTNGENSNHAVHIGDLDGSATFVVNLDPDAADETVTTNNGNMIYVYNGEGAKDLNLRITNEAIVLSGLENGERLRFATVASAGYGFGNEYIARGRGVINSGFRIEYEDYKEATDAENQKYNGGTEFTEDKPGNQYVTDIYKDGENVYLVRDSSKDAGLSDSGKTVINMSRANYKNAVYMDRLNKRLGEARYINGEEEQGMWVRLRHDRIGLDGEFRSQNTMYEMGYDVKQDCDNGERRVGFAIDYMDGSTSYSNIIGEGETKRYGLWLYDTWLGDKGHYTDYVLKWGHLDNDFDIRDKDSLVDITGDYSNNVFSASAEYGKKNDMGGGWYFEPQAQLQFARVTGADYVTSQDTKVSLDGINSLIGRAGFRLGRDLNENSTVYIKADLLHEFLGDQTITATDATGTFRDTFENKGTWYDVGFGFATALSNSSYAFMDFEKSFGNDNDETYQINAGVQWTF